MTVTLIVEVMGLFLYYLYATQTCLNFKHIVFFTQFPLGVLVQIKTSRPPVCGKDESVFLRFSQTVHVFLVLLLHPS